MGRKTTVVFMLFIILTAVSAYAARVFIFLYSKGTGTNPQEVFTQTVESQRCPDLYSYNSQSKACEANPVCPSGSTFQNGTCVTSTNYLCSANNQTYTSESTCTSSCQGTAQCTIGQDVGVYVWGSNPYGQIGDGTTTIRLTPVQTKAADGAGYLSGVVAIAPADFHSLALKSDGTVWAWGDNLYGQLGDGTTTQRLTPVQVKGPGGSGYLTGIVAIAAGRYYSLALKSDGTVWAWGWNNFGQLGDGTTTDKYIPIQVKGPGGSGYLTGITAIAAKGDYSLALKSDGTVWTWGINNYGQLGDGTTTHRYYPIQVKGPDGVGYLTNVITVGGDWHHALAVKSDGTVWSWGDNLYGQLGDGTTTQRLTPIQVKGPGGSGYLTGVVAVAAGSYQSFALKSDGTVWAWGYNNSGQLGDGTTTGKLYPVQVKGFNGTGYLSGIQAVAAAGWRGFALGPIHVCPLNASTCCDGSLPSCTIQGTCSPSCPSGYTLISGTCVTTPTCPGNGTYNSSTSKCQVRR